jgi:putative MATE family efflux protein
MEIELNPSTREQKPEKENLTKVVWAMAWPAVALNLMQVVNSMLDISFVGNLPKDSLTAYSAVTNVVFFMFSMAMAMATATTAIVSRAYGAGDHHEVPEAAGQAISWGFVTSILLGVIGSLIAPYCSQMMIPADSPGAMDLMTKFQYVYIFGLPGIFIVQVLAGCMRGVGDSRSPMWISGIQILLHIVLNFFLIFPPHNGIPGAGLGILGAALALTLSATIAGGLYMVLAKRTGLGKVNFFAKPSLAWGLRFFRLGLPAAMMNAVRVFSLTIFSFILKTLPNGAEAIASLRPGFAIESVMFMPAFGLGIAATALVGQSLGMKRPERAESIAWLATKHASIVTLLICGPIFVYAPAIAHQIIRGEVGIADLSGMFIQTLCLTEVFFAISIVLSGSMQGAGDSKNPFYITVICGLVLRSVLAWILAHGVPGLVDPMGAHGAYYALAATQLLQGIITAVIFKKGAWKTARV